MADRPDVPGPDGAADEVPPGRDSVHAPLAEEARHRIEELDDQHADFEVAGPAPLWLRPLLAYGRAMDRVSERIGDATKYLVIAIVLIGFFNALLRYIGRFTGQQLTSNRWFEIQWYLFAAVFLLAFAYILKNEINVRVDFWYADRSVRTKAWIDFIGHLVALLPFCVLAIWVLWTPILTSWGASPDGSFSTWRVWEIWERSPDPSGLPRAPVKSLLLIGFVLLFLQGVAEVAKLVAELTGHGRIVRRGAPEAPLRIE